MPTLIVEGWRFLPHSYAIVNHAQLARLASAPGLRLLVRDAPTPKPDWTPVRGVFDAEEERRVAALPVAPPGTSTDALLRIASPYRFDPDPGAARTFVFVTCEHDRVPGNAVSQGLPLDQALHAGRSRGEVRIITPSRWSARGIERSGVAPGLIDVVPHGVDADVFRPMDPARRAHERSLRGLDGCFVFCHCGAMTGSKSPDVLLRGFAEIASQRPDARLVIKGLDGMYDSARLLRTYGAMLPEAARAALAGRVIYEGGVLTMREQADLYGICDAYLSPYRGEGFNLPVLEAAACGLPVICTAGGPTDDFTHESFALRIPSRPAESPFSPGLTGLEPDAAAFAAHMRRVMDDGAFRAGAQRAGPAFVRAGWTWEHATAALRRVLGV